MLAFTNKTAHKINIKWNTQPIILMSGLWLMMLCSNCTQEASLKTGYIRNQVLFESYSGTEEAKKVLTQMRQKHQFVLDSLRLIQTDSAKMIYQYEQKQFQVQEAEYVEQSNQQLWHQINEYIKLYGEDEDYDYIFGATGNGSLMYAPETRDITTQVAQYINVRYAGE